MTCIGPVDLRAGSLNANTFISPVAASMPVSAPRLFWRHHLLGQRRKQRDLYADDYVGHHAIRRKSDLRSFQLRKRRNGLYQQHNPLTPSFPECRNLRASPGQLRERDQYLVRAELDSRHR